MFGWKEFLGHLAAVDDGNLEALWVQASHPGGKLLRTKKRNIHTKESAAFCNWNSKQFLADSRGRMDWTHSRSVEKNNVGRL